MADEDEIRDLWQTMADGWSQGDAARFASVFAADVDFVTVRGEEHHGRTAVEEGHARLFGTIYRDTALVPDILLTRRLAEGILLVHVTTEVVPDGMRTHAQAVVTRDDNGWSIAAFHNMIPHVPQRNSR